MKPTTIIQLPVETLQALKDALPHGSLEKMVIKCGFSRQYINNIFSGEAKVNTENYSVIKEAQAIIKKAREEAAQIDEDIKKTLAA